MASLTVYNQEGVETGSKEFDPGIFGKLNKQVMFEAVVMQEANKRLGTHSTKTRAQVAGSGKKPFPQKGTGRARQGSFQSPITRGGGIAHGPHPRDYSYQLPKKQRRRAIRSAILSKFLDDQVIVVDKFEFRDNEPSTKTIEKFLKQFREKIEGKFEVEYEKDENGERLRKGKRVRKELIAPRVSAVTGKPLSASFLFVVPENKTEGSDEKKNKDPLFLSSRNIPWTGVDSSRNLNTRDILRYTMLVVTEETLDELVAYWQEKN
jgi:large subunit ribosomal protein L4